MEFDEKPDRFQLGRLAEERACQWFLAQGAGRSLLARNYRCKQGEIDLIFFEEPRAELVFIEVRFRSKRAWSAALESVTWQKRQRIRRAAEVFLAKEGARYPHARGMRLDVIALDCEGDKILLSHTENTGWA